MLKELADKLNSLSYEDMQALMPLLGSGASDKLASVALMNVLTRKSIAEAHNNWSHNCTVDDTLSEVLKPCQI